VTGSAGRAAVTRLTAAQHHDAMAAAQQAQNRRIHGPETDFWGAVAHRFRAGPRRELDPFLAKLASFLEPDDVFVDAGGGAGRNCLPMALRCREVINIDPSAGMGREFLASAEEAGIRNARFIEADWLEADVSGDVLLAAHVTYFVPQIVPFVEKLSSAARRRAIIAVLTVPPPNQHAPFFELVYGEERALVPGPDHLVAVLHELRITPEVIDTGPASARRPLAQTREAAVENELVQGWVRREDFERAREAITKHFEELFVETPQGFARRSGEGARELMITWERVEH
jgi:ubiquinone/menaquinone biosynthesis C-methylase UbiE